MFTFATDVFDHPVHEKTLLEWLDDNKEVLSDKVYIEQCNNCKGMFDFRQKISKKLKNHPERYPAILKHQKLCHYRSWLYFKSAVLNDYERRHTPPIYMIESSGVLHEARSILGHTELDQCPLNEISKMQKDAIKNWENTFITAS